MYIQVTKDSEGKVIRKEVVLNEASLTGLASYSDLDQLKYDIAKMFSYQDDTINKIFGWGERGFEVQKSAGAEFSGEAEMNKLIASENKMHKVMLYYWKAKKFTIENKVQFKELLFNGRNMKAASKLANFPKEKLISAILKVDEHSKKNDYNWTLETLLKFITTKSN